MLSEKPWKAEALLRLLLSVLICIFLGAIAGAVVGYCRHPQPAHAVLFPASTAGAVAFFVGALAVLGRPWKLEKFIRDFVILLGCLYGGFALWWCALHWLGNAADLKDPTWQTVIATLGFQGAALVLVARSLREHKTGWAGAFGFTINWPQALLLGGLGVLAAYPICYGLQWLSAQIMTRLAMNPQEQTAVEAVRAPGTWLDSAVLGVVTIALAPVAEEVLFRGILYPAIKQRGFPRLALWGTSLLFAAIHLNLPIFLSLTLLALVLTWLYERTGNLLAPVTAHAIFNAIGFAALTYQKFEPLK